jgi:hypothetical protein
VDGIGDFFLTTYIDGKARGTELVSLANIDGPRGRHTVTLPDNSFGRRIYITCQKAEFGAVGIADIWVNYDELPIPVVLFDSGEVQLSNNIAQPQWLILHVFAPVLMQITGQLFIDGQLIFSGDTAPIGPGYVGPLRVVVPPIEGRSARVILKSVAYFCVMNVELGGTPLGDDTVKYVDLGGRYPAQVERRRAEGVGSSQA